MLYRVKQFLAALKAEITPKDRQFVNCQLTKAEQELFYKMDPVDQRHCLDVARTCLSLMVLESRPLNRQLLIKAALLHDVGKTEGDLGLWDRVAVVLLRAVWPSKFFRLARQPGTPFHTALNHPKIGSRRCQQAGCPPELVNLVARHQSGGPGVELELLIRADRMN